MLGTSTVSSINGGGYMRAARGPYLIRWGVYKRRHTYPVGYGIPMKYCEGSLSMYHSSPMNESPGFLRVSTVIHNGLADYAWELNDIPLLQKVEI